MKNRLVWNGLILGIICLFVGTSIVSSTIDEKTVLFETDKGLSKIYSLGDVIVLFEDDFNDNQKDFNLWTEVYSDGTWEEKNKRCEFQLYEPGGGSWKEGIKSIEFIVPLNPVSPLKINWDIICDIVSTNWAGSINLKVTDGTNWLWAKYHRFTYSTKFRDSNDQSTTTLKGNKPYGTYSNEIQIYSDGYIVTMDADSSGMIYDPLFKLSVPLTIDIYVGSDGYNPGLFFRSGFDNVKVTFKELETKKAFIFGRLDNLSTVGDVITFEALNIRAITLFPFTYNRYTSKEFLTISKNYFGLITPRFIFAFCRLKYQPSVINMNRFSWNDSANEIIWLVTNIEGELVETNNLGMVLLNVSGEPQPDAKFTFNEVTGEGYVNPGDTILVGAPADGNYVFMLFHKLTGATLFKSSLSHY